MKNISLLIFIFFFANPILGQVSKDKLVSPKSIIFTDTLHDIVTDTFVHDLGTILTRDTLLVKYFKYVGNDKAPVYITRTWTGDPFWISEYPKGELKKGEIYSITICFLFSNRGNGRFEKAMGFYLTNGENIKFVFKGNVMKKESNNIGQINPKNDSSLYYGAKSFMLHVLKTLEPSRKKRNEDSLCRALVPLDTLKARLQRPTFCKIENLLYSNSPVFSEFLYKIDSSCARLEETNIFYFRISLANKDTLSYNNQKPYYYGYLWYKIWFDGKKYWLIPGHHYTDVCLDFIWMPCNYQVYKRNMAPWTPCRNQTK